MPAAEAIGNPAVRRTPPGGRLGALLLRPAAPPQWRALLYACGVVSLAGIVLTELRVPSVSDLATFFSLTLFINGPYSPLTPVGFEPILMAYGRLYPPLLVAVLGVVGQLMVEYVNYHLYDAALRTDVLRHTRESPTTRRVLGWYRAAPFVTTIVVAFTPLPYWTVRIAAPLSRYPMARHLSATAVGRLPRLWLYAAIGTLLPFSSGAILCAGLGVALVSAAILLARRRRRAASPV